METFIIFLLIYCLSTYGTYKYIQTSHSKNGEFAILDTEFSDVFFTFAPFINIAPAIAYYFKICSKEEKRNYNKFFKIEK